MQKIINQPLVGKHNKPIVTDFFFKKNKIQKPIVIFCHGYKGYKDWGSWNLVAEHFANENFFFVKFNFSHNGGTIKEPIDFPDLETFSNNNCSIELDDLQSVIDFILNHNDFNLEINKTNIILIGHSRGGGVVTLKSSQNNQITKVISWAGISDIGARFPKGEALEKWRKDDVIYAENVRTKQQMPNKFQVYENFIANRELLDIPNAVKKLKIPQLIIYGTNDEVVLPIEAANLHKWNPKSTIFGVENMNHALGNTQPWVENSMPKEMQLVVNKTIDFIKS